MGWRDELEAAQRAPIDLVALGRLVDDLWPGARVRDATLITGGLGSVLHAVELLAAPVERAVLRQLLPEFGDDATTVRREAAAHRGVGAAGIPVPAVLWDDPDGTILGRPALLLEYVRGSSILPDLASEDGRAALAATVAGIHALDADRVPGLDHLPDVLAHADRFGPPGREDPAVDIDALGHATREVAGAFVPRRQVIHCDLHGGNVLWDGAAVTGVLDWPGAATGVGLADEAYAVMDTTLALGHAAGSALADAFDEVRPTPPPTDDERRLWRAVALRRGLPTPGPWAETYRAAGLDISDDEAERRYVIMVEAFIEEA